MTSASTDLKTVINAYDQRTDQRRERDSVEVAEFKSVSRGCRTVVFNEWVPAGCSVLDIGCGQGAALPSLIRFGMQRYMGWDISKSALAECEIRLQRLQQNPPKPPPWADLTTYPSTIEFAVEQKDLLTLGAVQRHSNFHTTSCAYTTRVVRKYQIVLCENVIHYLNPPEVLQWIAREALEPNGTVIVVCIDSDKIRTIPKDHPFFTIADETEKDYKLTFQNLVQDVRERKISRHQLIEWARVANLRLVQDRSLSDIYEMYRFQKDFSAILRWRSDLLECNRALLSIYRYYVFKPKSSCNALLNSLQKQKKPAAQ